LLSSGSGTRWYRNSPMFVRCLDAIVQGVGCGAESIS
jgi:hypothetical protein